MFIYAKKLYKIFAFFAIAIIICFGFVFVKKQYSNADFGKTFGAKAAAAEKKLLSLQQNFNLCAPLCNSNTRFMQSIVFPEVMRYNTLKDGVEAESLRTLYVEFGEEYANFSIGIFQMKPTFAVQVETKAKQLLSESVNTELQLKYNTNNETAIRRERVNRLQDEDWQMIYLTAFIAICNAVYKEVSFKNETEKLQWYATIYNAGFDKSAKYITQKINSENFYLNQGMPGKKFKYAAIATWFYKKQ